MSLKRRPQLEMLEDRRLLTAIPFGLFAAPAGLPGIGQTPVAVAAGDFNNDLKLDLVVAGGTAQTIYDTHGVPHNVFNGAMQVLLGTGGGGFALSPQVITLKDQPFSMVAADFNGDHFVDLAVNAGQNVLFFSGTGTGAFKAAAFYPANSLGPGEIVAADVNNDGRLDIAASGFLQSGTDQFHQPIVQSEVAVLLNLGKSGFSASVLTHIAGTALPSLAAADFNDDGKTDLAVGLVDQVKILSSNGDGTFSFPTAIIKPSFGSLSAVKLNADAFADLVWKSGSRTISYALGNPDGTFGAVQDISTAAKGGAVSVGDFNGDGALDLVTIHDAAGSGFYLGNGAGAFSAVNDLTTAMPGISGDFNGDGRADLVAADGKTISLAVAPLVYARPDRTLVITGSRRADVISVTLSGAQMVTMRNGVAYTSRASRVRRIEVTAGIGDDKITIDPSIFAAVYVSAGAGNDTVTGGSGNDTLQGDNGNDVLMGGAGNDVLQGGKNDDDLFGGAGSLDSIYGNAGNDTFHKSDFKSEWLDFSGGDRAVS